MLYDDDDDENFFRCYPISSSQSTAFIMLTVGVSCESLHGALGNLQVNINGNINELLVIQLRAGTGQKTTGCSS